MNLRGHLLAFDLYAADVCIIPDTLGRDVRDFLRHYPGCQLNFMELCSYFRMTNKSAR